MSGIGVCKGAGLKLAMGKPSVGKVGVGKVDVVKHYWLLLVALPDCVAQVRVGHINWLVRKVNVYALAYKHE